MIDISPKALRFARLAAEQQPAFAGDPQIAIVEQDEASFRQKDSGDRLGRCVEISDRTADFCLRVVTALLEQPGRFETSEWDGNDYVFLQAATRSLREQLARSNAQTL